MQQLTCKIDLPCSFYSFFFSFVLIELKPFVLKGKVLEEKVWKSVENSETRKRAEYGFGEHSFKQRTQ